MEEERKESSPEFDVWLRRGLLAVAGVLLVLMCFLVWRISVMLAAISDDVKKGVRTVAKVLEKVDALNERVEKLRKRLAPRIDEIESIIDAVITLGKDAETPLAPAAEREIDHLFSRIGAPGLKFGHEGKTDTYSDTRLRFQLFAKYKLYKNSITSAEDFIEKVTTRTIGGHEYYVIEQGKKRPLAEWFREALKKRRAEIEGGWD